MEYTVRNFKTTDLPKLIKVVRTIDLDENAQNEIKTLLGDGQELDNLKAISLLLSCSESLINSDEFINVLSGMIEPKLTNEQIKELDADRFIEIVFDLYDRESTKRFLKILGRATGLSA